jgi:hypothetical protein
MIRYGLRRCAYSWLLAAILDRLLSLLHTEGFLVLTRGLSRLFLFDPEIVLHVKNLLITTISQCDILIAPCIQSGTIVDIQHLKAY